MPQSAEANAITNRPLKSPMNIAEPNLVMENMANTPASPDEAAAVIITQPLMNDPTNDEKEKKKQQKKENIIDTIDEVADDCMWCCFRSADCSPNCDCTGCDNCCEDSGDCCTGCCEDGPSAENVNLDGDDVAGCLECCGACFECCSSD